MGNKIFISHSTKDKNLIEEFLEFLQTGLNIDINDIYCTSIEETIPTGTNFVEHIKENIVDTNLIIFLLTPNYFQSHFCLAELGAAWVLNSNIYPIIVPPMSYSSLDTTPLKGVTQSIILNEERDLIKMKDEFQNKGIISSSIGTGRFLTRLKVFLKKLQEIDLTTEQQFVSIEDFKKLEEQFSEVINEHANLEKEMDEHKEYIKKLEGIKDSNEVLKVKTEKLDEWEQFSEYVDDIKRKCSQLDDVVITSLYFEFKGNDERYRPDSQSYSNIWDILKRAEAEEFVLVDWDDFIVEPNHDDPKISNLTQKLNEFSYFIEKCSPDFIESFKQKYEMNISIASKRFWEKFFRCSVLI